MGEVSFIDLEFPLSVSLSPPSPPSPPPPPPPPPPMLDMGKDTREKLKFSTAMDDQLGEF